MSDDDQTAGQSLDELLVTLDDTPRSSAWRQRALGNLPPKKHIDKSSALTDDQKAELEDLNKKRRANSDKKSKAKRKVKDQELEEEVEKNPEVLFSVLDIRGPKNAKLKEFWKRRKMRDRDEEAEAGSPVRDMRAPADQEDEAEDGPGDSVQAPSGGGPAVEYLPADDWDDE